MPAESHVRSGIRICHLSSGSDCTVGLRETACRDSSARSPRFGLSPVEAYIFIVSWSWHVVQLDKALPCWSTPWEFGRVMPDLAVCN
jgi:hypothetical protein